MGNFSKLSCTDEFERDVGNLPRTFDDQNDSHEDAFQQFFDRWGHYIITKVYGGGSVTVTVTREGHKTKDFDTMKVRVNTDDCV